MTQFTLALPFALPPPEMAPDLVRNLDTPALAALLSRSASDTALPFDEYNATLPHESWLAQALGLSAAGKPAFASAVMRGMGHIPAEGTWFLVMPAHVQITRSHLSLADSRGLALSGAHSRALFELAKPYFEEVGKTLVYGEAGTWFMRADDWSDLHTSSPDAAIGLNLTDWLPSGAKGVHYRKLQNEIQMLWFEHDVNRERESQGLSPINSFWPWAPSHAPGLPKSHGALAVSGGSAWVRALANRTDTSFEALHDRQDRDPTLLACDLIPGAISGNWAEWLDHMHRLEREVIAPAMAALGDGRLRSLRLIISGRSSLHEITTTRMAQRAFWRRNTLERLLT